MKLVTFTVGDGGPRVGALNAEETAVVDLAAADDQPYFATMLNVIEAGDPAVAASPAAALECRGSPRWPSRIAL